MLLGVKFFKLIEVTERLCRLNGPMYTYLSTFQQTNFLLFTGMSPRNVCCFILTGLLPGMK